MCSNACLQQSFKLVQFGKGRRVFDAEDGGDAPLFPILLCRRWGLPDTEVDDPTLP